MAETGCPVGDEGDWCRVLLCGWNAIDEEARPVAGNIVGVTPKGPDLPLEEGLDCVHFEGGSLRFMSGYIDDSTVRQGVRENEVAYLQKPFTPMSLARKVREVLDTAPVR